ncbi:hypothetical protein PWT90_10103 [Aphanocladium album]|nr:hypothetical protein PWT90_10103 [Aphanocladium album]
MSIKIALTYVVQGDSIRLSSSQSELDEAAQCDVLARALDTLCATNENLGYRNPRVGSFAQWSEVVDFVHPFGDSRGDAIASVWVVEANKKVVYLVTKDSMRAAILPAFGKRLLRLSDFEPTESPLASTDGEQTLPGPFWEPEMNVPLREEAFLKPILRDFGYAWRHIMRWRMNNTTFRKLAYGTIWLLTINFNLYELERPEIGFKNEANVLVTDLPQWRAPTEAFLRVGSSWPEVLYGEDEVSEAAIQMLVWAAASTPPCTSTALDMLPVEIQDRIIYYGGVSFVASARLGCKLGLGSRFSWIERGSKIGLMEQKKCRTACSPVESRILFHGFKSGLVYQREREYNSAESKSLSSRSNAEAPFHCRFFHAQTLVY